MTCSVCKKDGHNKSSCGKDPKPKPKAKEAPVPAPEEQEKEPDTEDVAMIRALATEVLNDLGAGHTESVYHNAMKVGLHDLNLKFETERDILIKFRDRYVGTVRADLIIEQRLVVELKSSSGTDSAVSDAMEQCKIYMRETKVPAGVVVVFPKRVGGKLVVASA
jgi:GxxExxY protein